ncbi:MAG: DNA double-strand break repair protein Mre11, partial [Nitrosarchaeum sp.]
RCFWRIISKEISDSSVFLERPSMIDDEMLRLSVDAIGSEQNANFAVKELLPLLASGQIKEATQIIVEKFEKYKKEKNNDNIN